MTILEVSDSSHRQLQDIANSIAAARKVVVVTGAGISTNAGIPDFRSENGLYNKPLQPVQSNTRVSRHISQLSKQSPLPSAKSKDLFHTNVWKDASSTSQFYQFIASLRQSIHEDARRTTATHRFLRTLRDRRKLVRCYTQNIDGLESQHNLSSDLPLSHGNRSRFSKKTLTKLKTPASVAPGGEADPGCEVVPLHGDLQTLRCTLCLKTTSWSDLQHTPQLLKGRPPHCPSCTETSDIRLAVGKRETKIGTLRPNIVLYGEEHPSADTIGKIIAHDLSLCPDLLLVLGTSLHVHGLKTLVREFAKAVHARPNGRGKVIFVNLTRPAESVWKDVIDYWVCMDCDKWVERTRQCRPDIWKMQSQLSPNTRKVISPSKSLKAYQKCIEDEKENVILDSDASLPSSPPQPKGVLTTPKKQKQRLPLQEQSSPIKYLSSPPSPRMITPCKTIRQPLHAQFSPTKRLALNQGSTQREIPDSDPTSSLPTPPSSGVSTPRSGRKRKTLSQTYEERFVTPSKRRRLLDGDGGEGEGFVTGSKRRRLVDADGEDVREGLLTPSKRTRSTVIWED